MRLAIVGANARALCRAAGTEASVFPALRAAADRDWDLLALTRNAASTPGMIAPRSRCLVLPGDCAPSVARRAEQVVGYGLSPRDTLTLSSTARAGQMLCLQRSVRTLGGTLLEPQELPLPDDLAALPDEDAMLAALLRLLCAP